MKTKHAKVQGVIPPQYNDGDLIEAYESNIILDTIAFISLAIVGLGLGGLLLLM